MKAGKNRERNVGDKFFHDLDPGEKTEEERRLINYCYVVRVKSPDGSSVLHGNNNRRGLFHTIT